MWIHRCGNPVLGEGGAYVAGPWGGEGVFRKGSYVAAPVRRLLEWQVGLRAPVTCFRVGLSSLVFRHSYVFGMLISIYESHCYICANILTLSPGFTFYRQASLSRTLGWNDSFFRQKYIVPRLLAAGTPWLCILNLKTVKGCSVFVLL